MGKNAERFVCSAFFAYIVTEPLKSYYYEKDSFFSGGAFIYSKC